jgi:hypothetical protein
MMERQCGLCRYLELIIFIFADPEPGRGFILADDRLHNAGFDAFITGVCFMSMMQYLGKDD